jgi:aquaporin Z
MSFAAALRAHWPEYAIEAGGLAAFLLAAVGMTVLLEHPASPVRAALDDAFLRRVLMGLAMGSTAIALVYSPYGQRSGAHFNPALPLPFFRLGKVEPADALGYVAAQIAGGIAGVALATAVLGMLPAHPAVQHAVTRPGPWGAGAAFAAEVAISFGMMLVVLVVSNQPRIARLTGLCCGALVAAYIAFEAPISGMSMNPARSLGSAAVAGIFTAHWIYWTAPFAGMLLAAECYLRFSHARSVHCAKLHHQNDHRCIFRCGWGMP